MKTLKNIFGTAALALMGISMLASCTDGNDWSVDSAYDRLFGPTGSISVTAQETKAAISFTKISGATAYEVEYSTDSLYLDDVSSSSTVIKLSSNSDTLRDLMGDTKYYLRLRSVADGKNSSKWVYYQSGTKSYFTTKAEQIFNVLTADDYSYDSCHVSWTAKSAVDTLTLWKGTNEVQTIMLTDAQKAAGQYTFTGLESNTTYTTYLRNGKAKRGSLTFTTPAAPPQSSIIYNIPSTTTVLSQELIDEIATKAKAASSDQSNYSATVMIPGGAKLSVHGIGEDGTPSNLTIPDGMSIAFYGESSAVTPELDLDKNFDIAGSHAFVTFYNLNIVDNGAKYFINQSASATVSTFKIDKCNVSGQSTAFFRLQGSNGININTLELNNSIFHDMCTGYSFIHVDAGSGKGKIENIKITDCTLYNVATTGKMFIYSKNTNMTSITVDHLTMYNSIGNGNYLIDFGSTSYGASDGINISNSILTKRPSFNVGKNVRATADANFTNSYFTNDFSGEGKISATFLDVTADKCFSNPDAGNFTLILNDLISNKVGDSRWIPAE
jgi:hypothetical protein